MVKPNVVLKDRQNDLEELPGTQLSLRRPTFKEAPKALPNSPQEAVSSTQALYDAVRNDEFAAVTRQIYGGADPCGEIAVTADPLQPPTVLQAAVTECRFGIFELFEQAKLLLKCGASPDTEPGNWGDALHIAAWRGNLPLAKLLLEEGSNVNSIGGKYGSALQAAVKNSHSRMVRLLLERGIDVNMVAGKFGTALQAGAKNGNLEVIRLLVQQGADIDVKGGHFGSALQAAVSEGHFEVERYLRAKQAGLQYTDSPAEKLALSGDHLWTASYPYKSLIDDTAPGTNISVGFGGDSRKLKPLSSATEVQHIEYEPDDVLPYQSIRFLGTGGSGSVDEVRVVHPLSECLETYARKQIKAIRLSPIRSHDSIRKEIAITKRACHRHIIGVVGTYSQSNFYGIIMTPVADCNLHDYFENLGNISSSDAQKLSGWLGCLASGLHYLHKERIRHKDIKPGNLLIKGQTILYADFGLARDALYESNTDTSGTVFSRTAMYCAPEVAAQARRGSKSDLFSLGCVFLEIITLLCGKSLDAFESFRTTHEKRSYHANLNKTLDWILQLAVHMQNSPSSEVDISPQPSWTETIKHQLLLPLGWCYAMLQPHAANRVNARQLISLIVSAASVLLEIPEGTRICLVNNCCNELQDLSSEAVNPSVLEYWPAPSNPDEKPKFTSWDAMNIRSKYKFSHDRHAQDTSMAVEPRRLKTAD